MFKKIIFITSVAFFALCNFANAAEVAADIGAQENVANDAATDKSSDEEVKQTTLGLSGAWARASLSSNNNSAAYMSINNPTDKQITILGASAAVIANNVELHKSFVDEKGISRMTSIDKIVVPANSTISLAPGGIHIMLFDLKRKLVSGEKFEIILALEEMDAIIVEAEIK